MEPFKISAKNLGQTALSDFCPRCYWINLKTGFKLPWQSFPGIFSSIDSYTKSCIHHIIDQRTIKEIPPWMKQIGNVIGYEKVPHWSKSLYLDAKTNITLSGAPDDIFVNDNETRAIIDWKTAKFTANQDNLLVLYEVQLNVYSILCGTKETTLFLVYMEPQTDKSVAGNNIIDSGFNMGFHATVVPIENDRSKIRQALQTTRDIFELTTPPAGKEKCKNCEQLDKVIELIK